jgi:hypothetical protein
MLKLTEDLSGPDLDPYRLDGGMVSLGCLSCPLLGVCGGQTRVGGGWSCESRCASCDRTTCDLVCFGKPRVFARALREVRSSFDWKDIGLIRSPESPLPSYIPTIHHASRRRLPLRSPWVALPLDRVLSRRKRSAPVVSSPAELRRRFGLAPDTKLLLLGTGEDHPIEQYWKWHTKFALAEALGRLGWDAAVVPNYSFFVDDPRIQHLHNRKRSLICGEEWSRNGIPTIPYLLALTPGDYTYWHGFLEAHPEVTMLAKEFQTGLGNWARGTLALDAIARLQDNLKRPFHFVAVGGAQYREKFRNLFDSSTLVDSVPFMKTVRRQRPVRGDGRLHWKSAGDRGLDGLLRHNLNRYRPWLAEPKVVGSRRKRPARTARSSANEDQFGLLEGADGAGDGNY